jgi:hypothetical protein
MRLEPAELTPLAIYQCGSASCPAVYTAAGYDDDLVVQGWIAGAQLAEGVPPGEQRVVLPRETVLEAARKLAARS